jgi:asparagine synthase (glutamine-hydrolysing)
MCGILGVASNVPALQERVLERMRDTMASRGPDDAGLWFSEDRRVALAHRRLAIIDLSSDAHQPMTDESGQVCIVFNGEIYNYRDIRRELEEAGFQFKTASDTEVLLMAYRAWGVECLARLNGMFAFALYDRSRQQLFIARDRAGEKPLFYSHVNGRFMFASELKALMADPTFPRELDLTSFQYYLAYGYVPGELCILRGVHKLGAGQALVYDINSNKIRSWRYWDLPSPPSGVSFSPEALEEELETLLLDSVRLRMIADVPIGILLSGGIDSSLITAMAVRVSPKPVKTFTISFPGHGTYDEGPYAKLVADHFKTDHTALVAEPASVKLLPDLARQYDEPMADSSMVPTYLVSRLVRQHATVALGGDGGDELFGGYPHYIWMQQQERIRRFIPKPLRAAVGHAAAEWMPVGLRGRNYLIGATADLPMSIAHVNLYFDHVTRARLLAPLVRQGAFAHEAPETYRRQLCNPAYSVLRQASEADFRTTMVDAYLVKVDRASMLASLEVRVPMLDHRLIEFAFGKVPDSLKATRTERKILLRRMAKRLLPQSLDLNRKQGFSLPLASWLKGEWGRFMREVLEDADRRLFDPIVIRSLLDGQQRGMSNTARLFSLTMFELWRREYRIHIPSGSC